MSIKQLNAAWQTQTETHTQKLVLLALADNANDHGHCWPSVLTIAAKCQLTKQAVLKQIKGLERAGLLQTSRANGRSNRYILVMQPVNEDYRSTAFTGKQDLPPPVNEDYRHRSTAFTQPVNVVYPNHQEPSVEPSIEPKKARKQPEPPAIFQLPFNTDSFREAWKDWERHRKQLRKPLTDSTARIQLKKLAQHPEEYAIFLIQTAIERSWSSFFVPNDPASKTEKQREEEKKRKMYNSL
jgi:hypothetical protein